MAWAVAHFEQKMEQYQELAQKLSADDREDEAVFAKVQRNVYDIFHTIFTVAFKTAGENDEKAKRFFLAKLGQIPQSWQKALVCAERHEDVKQAYLERLKLNAAEEIRKEFHRIWEVER